MGRRIITNEVDKWEVFSSYTDSVIATFTTKAGIKRFVAMERIYDAKLKAIEELMCFPRGWTVNEGLRLGANATEARAYLDWFEKINEDGTTYAEYYAAIDAKLEELLALNSEEVDEINPEEVLSEES